MLSNSDPSNVIINNDFQSEYLEFFEKEFQHYGFRIQKVMARRNINSKGKNRGHISELLITNY
jgi:hypothetical protein